MFFGHRCTKRLLVAINVAYVVLAAALIVLGFRYSSYLTSLPILPGIMACGFLLFLLAILGLVATCKQYRMFLFIYMILLIIIFIVQISISAACIAVDDERTQLIIKEAWDMKTDKNGFDYVRIAEGWGRCCGYDENDTRRHPENMERNTTEYFQLLYCLEVVETCSNKNESKIATLNPINDRISTVSRSIDYNVATILPPITPDDLMCPPCKEVLEDNVNLIFKGVGGIALGLSFIELMPIVITYKHWKGITINSEGIVLTSVS